MIISLQKKKKNFTVSVTSISSVLKQLHDLSASLHPPVLDDLGLTEALRNLVRRVSSDNPIEFSFLASGDEGDLPGEVKINLYRIVQEALSNIIKHSDAREAMVYFGHDGKGIELVVSDDGRGFEDLGDTDGIVHLGLLNMRERAEQINGTFNIIPCGRGVTRRSTNTPSSIRSTSNWSPGRTSSARRSSAGRTI